MGLTPPPVIAWSLLFLLFPFYSLLSIVLVSAMTHANGVCVVLFTLTLFTHSHDNRLLSARPASRRGRGRRLMHRRLLRRDAPSARHHPRPSAQARR